MAQVPKYNYGLLDAAQEDALHATRLLAVEERPFARVVKCLNGEDSPLKATRTQLPTPPPEDQADGITAIQESYNISPAQLEAQVAKCAKFREEMLLDLQALDNSIIRMQLVLEANAREREHYAAQKAQIIATMKNVRENTAELRIELAAAQAKLKVRKTYDKLAERILEDKTLKSREEADQDIQTLEGEIEELQQENEEINGLWKAREEQFRCLVAEGEAMRKVIKGVKDEVEAVDDDKLDEGIAEMEEESGAVSKEAVSTMGTPILHAATPRGGDETPLPTHLHDQGVSTPRPTNKFLEVDDVNRASSRGVSPSGGDMMDGLHGVDETQLALDDLGTTVQVESPFEGVDETMDDE